VGQPPHLSAPNLVVADDTGVRTITIDRPDVKNALTAAMRDGLVRLLAEADADPDVRVVVLTAVDPVFTAGVDFKEAKPSELPTNPGQALRAMTTPVICAVNGACVSGGLELALSSSFVVASDRARFADTHARLGAVATWGLTALLPRAVGIRKARELSMTGNFVDAAEALRIGLVNHVVPHDELRSFTAMLAADVSANGAVAEVLSLYDRGQSLGFDDALALEAGHTANRAFDPDAFRAAGAETARRGSTS
jgi:enoyl-CoA hydratase